METLLAEQTTALDKSFRRPERSLPNARQAVGVLLCGAVAVRFVGRKFRSLVAERTTAPT
jgi:hypothetical protein